MEESNVSFCADDKPALQKRIMEDHALPDFGASPARTSYLDGCKVYFPDDSFVVCRFSGTEPLLRIFAEAHSKVRALGYIEAWKNLLNL
jgi:phosphomannomutase